MDTDAEVIRASLRHPYAFEEIFDRHYEAIRGYLIKRLGPDDGDELASEVFATAFATRDRYLGERPNARPWLYGIASNMLSHHLRSRSRRAVAIARLAARTDIAVDLEDVAERLDADREVAQVLAAVERMEAPDREVILLAAWEGLSYGDIADALDIPVGTVRSRLHRARRALQRAVGHPPALATRSSDHA